MKYKVPFVNYPLQYKTIKREIDRAIFGCLKRGNLIFRKETQEFENNLAKFVGSKYGISCDSCTGGLFLSLFALGIKKGDEVITVSHTYIATIDVIWHVGARPILVDIGEDMEMDPALIEPAITKKTKAIIPVHLDGRMCDMEQIMKIAKKYNLFVIEDAAQAIGAKFKGKPAGSWGHTGCFSFYPAKILGSYGDGGAIVTKSKKLARKLYLLRDHGEMPSYLRKPKDKDKIYFFGFNSLLDNIQAAVLNVKLKHLPKWIKRRREIAKIYHEGLKDIEYIKLPPPPTETGPHFDVFQNYVIRAQKRDELEKYLQKNGIETMVKWRIPNHKQKSLKILHKFHLPMTEKISKEVLSLPIYPELKN
ncbi:DegT/DnrJ/EryC1/StrS family aminotransferase, partial [Candidatus Parcubacteria bacterium]|nr:DegT/DnrJ/EryC1/StrS family aminotransferase [Candidatus Parcubacteria bacterium]